MGSTTTRSRQLGKRVAYIADDLRRSDVGDIVLAYHRIGGHTPSPVDLPTTHFARQMAHLRAAMCTATLDSLIVGSSAAESATARVVVTFDDGTSDFVDEALPVIVKYCIPVTLYLATEFVDSKRPYPADGTPISWRGLREALSTGLVTIGAHTHTHRLLDRCSLAEAEYELDTCIGRIEDELGVTAHHFAYPKAVAPRDGAIGALVRSRFQTAAVAGTRPNVPGQIDPWSIYRSPIQNADGWEGFVRKVGGGMRVEDDLRRLINLVRYRGRES